MLNIIELCISHNKRIALLVKYLSCEKKFCKCIPKAENGTRKLLLGSVILRPR